MSPCLLLLTLAFSSVATAREWSVEVFTGSTVGVSFADLHELDATRIVNCDLLIECEIAEAAPMAPVKRRVAPVPVAADRVVIIRGSERTEQDVVETKRCASFIQGRLTVRYFSPSTRLSYADAATCEAATHAEQAS